MVRLIPRPDGESFLSWYNAGLTILWPGLEFWTKSDWRGVHNLGSPGDGLVVAANHISWFDPLVLAKFVNDSGRSPRFLAKSSVFELPLAGQIFKGADQIPVFRESSNAAGAVSAAIDAVNNGECVVMYPEGTITRDPDIWPMTGKTGAARIALYTRKPLIPVAQWGAQEVMAPYKLEANLWPRKTMHMVAGDPIDLSDLYDLELTEEVFQAATNRLMDTITDMLSQLRGETPPDHRWSMSADTYVPRGPTQVQPAGASSTAASSKETAETKGRTAKKASAAKKSAATKASAAKKSAATKASAAKKSAATKASAAKKATATKASAAKKSAATKASAAKKSAATEASAAKKTTDTGSAGGSGADQ